MLLFLLCYWVVSKGVAADSTELALARSELEVARDTIAGLQKQVQLHAQEEARMVVTLDEEQEKVRELQETTSELESENAELKAEVDTLMGFVKELNMEIRELKNAAAQGAAAGPLSLERNLVDPMDSEPDAARPLQLKELQEQVEDLQLQLREAKFAFGSLERKHQTLEQEAQRLRAAAAPAASTPAGSPRLPRAKAATSATASTTAAAAAAATSPLAAPAKPTSAAASSYFDKLLAKTSK